MKSCHIPLWSVLVLQCVLILGVFGALIAIYTVQMDSSTSTEVLKRLEARVAGSRERILAPFLVGKDASSNLATLLMSDPKSYRAMGNSSSINDDAKFLQVASALVANNPQIVYANQISEDNNTVSSDGLPYLSSVATTSSLSYKLHRNNMYVVEAPITVPQSTFRTLIPAPISGSQSFLKRAIESSEGHNFEFSRFWSKYRMADADRQTISAGGSIGTIQTPFCDLCGAFTILLEARGQRYANKVSWLVSVVVDISHLNAALLSLTDGLADGFASVYDISSSDEALHTLLATTDPNVYIRDSGSSSNLFSSHTSPNRELNEWFAAAMQETRKLNTLEHSFEVPKRFISYAHIKLSSASSVLVGGDAVPAAQDLHLFVVVSTPSHPYFGDFHRTRNTIIGVGVGFAVFVVMLCAAVMIAIYSPLQAMSHNISLAAHLDNEEVKPTTSYFSEIENVSVAISKVNQILIDARPFMPASMLLSESEADTEETAKEFEDEKRLRLIAKKQKILQKIIEKSESSDQDGLDEEEEEDIFREDDDDDDEEGSVETSSTTDLNVSSRPPTGARHSIHSALEVGHRMAKAHTTGKRHSHTKNRSANSLLRSDSSITIKSRRVAVLCVNVRGFTTLPTFAINTLSEYSKTLLDLVSASAASERGVIDSFHGDHFVISFNAIRAAASPAKKAAMCSMAIASAASSTPFRALSMGAACGTAMVGPLGTSNQRRMSIVGCCYTRALRLQRASATLERSVAPLFFAPTGGGAAERVADYSNCYNCLIDKNAYTESRDVAETLLVGSLAAPVKVRTISTVLNKMNTLYMNNKQNSIVAAGDHNPAGSAKNLPTLQRINTLGGGNIMTVNSFSVNSVHPSNIHGTGILGKFSTHNSHAKDAATKEPTSTTVKLLDSSVDEFSDSMLYNGGVVPLMGTNNVNNANNSPEAHSNNNNQPMTVKIIDGFYLKSRECSKGEDDVQNTLNRPADDKLNASATVNKRSTTQAPDPILAPLVHESSFISDMIQPLPVNTHNPNTGVRTTLRNGGGHQTSTVAGAAPSTSGSSVSGHSESSVSLFEQKSTSVVGRVPGKPRLLPLPATTVYAVLKLGSAGGGTSGGIQRGNTSFLVSSEQDEWMYEMQKKSDNAAYRLINLTTECLLKGDMQKALQFAEERLEKALVNNGIETPEKGATSRPETGQKEDPLPLEVIIMKMVVASINAAGSSLATSSTQATSTKVVNSVETPLHRRSNGTTTSLKNTSFATADVGSAFGRDEETNSTYSTFMSQPLTSNLHQNIFGNGRLMRPEDLLVHFDIPGISLVGAQLTTPLVNVGDSPWGNVRNLITTKRLAAETNTNNKPPTPPPAPLSNIEAAEFASWLRICKVLSTVGAGGAPFVTATSFL